MLTPFYEARAWRIATQLVRRAPADLTLLESTSGDGHYIQHAVVPRAAASPAEAYEHRVADVNRHGTRVTSPGSPLPSALEEALRDPALLFDRAPALYRELASHLGLPDPRPLPSSTPEVIGLRFAVAWLQLHAALGRDYACRQGIDDQGYVRAQYFGAFAQPELAALAKDRIVDQRSWHPNTGFWFLAETGESPAACIDSHGIVHTVDDTKFDIWLPLPGVRRRYMGGGLLGELPSRADRACPAAMTVRLPCGGCVARTPEARWLSRRSPVAARLYSGAYQGSPPAHHRG
jgi:hypothetical protein